MKVTAAYARNKLNRKLESDMKNKVTPKSRTKTIKRELIIQEKRGSKSEPTLGNNLIIYAIWFYSVTTLFYRYF